MKYILAAGFKRSFNLLLFQKTEGIAFSRLRRVANVTACRALERWCRGGNRWTWDQVAEAVIFSSPHPPASAAGWAGGCTPQSSTGKKADQTWPPLGRGRRSSQPCHISSSLGLPRSAAPSDHIWVHISTWHGPAGRKHRQSKMPEYHPTPRAEQNIDGSCQLLSPQADTEHSYHRQYGHQITSTGLGRKQTEEKIKHRRLDSAVCVLLSSLNELRYTTGGWLQLTCSCFFPTQNLQF